MLDTRVSPCLLMKGEEGRERRGEGKYKPISLKPYYIHGVTDKYHRRGGQGTEGLRKRAGISSVLRLWSRAESLSGADGS